MEVDALRAKIVEVLQSQHLMTLATLRPDGYPQASILNYIADDITLYFATDAASQKVANIGFNNKVSVAIAVETEDFYKLSGLSMTGVARRILDKEAAAEFKAIVDHPGIDILSPVTVLAHLGLARAAATSGDTAAARKSYQDFFALWKDADPDLPVLVQAKKEYEQLK